MALSFQFFWRHATINNGITYNNDIAPYEMMHGLITGWIAPYMCPFSYPKNAGPIFSSQTITQEKRSEYYNKNEIDQHGFYWVCSEDEAKIFLANNYPEIHNKCLEDYINLFENNHNNNHNNHTTYILV